MNEILSIISVSIPLILTYFLFRKIERLQIWEKEVNLSYKSFLEESKKFENMASDINLGLNNTAFSLFYQAEFIKNKLIILIENTDAYLEKDKMTQLNQNLEYITQFTDNVRASLIKQEVSAPYIKFEVFQKGLGDNKFSKN